MNPRIVILMAVVLFTGALTDTLVMQIPPDFFVNPETGQPDVVIVVGSKAAFEDVMSATLLATKIGAECNELGELTLPEIHRTVHRGITLLFSDASGWANTLSDVERIGYPTVDVPDALLYKEWEHTPTTYTLPLWWFDDPHGFWGNNDQHFDPWETHEEIQVRFDVIPYSADTECVSCLHGNDISFHPIPGHRFSDWYAIPGLIYRADNIFPPPMIRVEPQYAQSTEGHFPVDLEPYTALFVPELWMVVHDRLPQFTLLNTVYTVVDAGPVLDINLHTGEKGSLHGMPYLITGTPHFDAPVYLYKNKPMDFHVDSARYTVELKEVDIDHNKALIDIYIEGELLDSFWMALSPLDFVVTLTSPRKRKEGFPQGSHSESFPFIDYDTCSDLNNNGELDPGEITNVITYDYNTDGIPDYHKWVIGTAEASIWADYTWFYYTDENYIPWLLFNTVDFAIQGFKVFIGAQGVVGLEIKVYWLENDKWWYTHLCADPWAIKPNYQIVLDAYQSGWDHIDDTNSYVYQPPGTGVWPPLGLKTWAEAGNCMFCGNGFLDANDGHTGYEYNCTAALFPERWVPEQCDLDRDENTTCDCRTSDWLLIESCTDSCDIEDPVIWHGPGIPVVELNVFLCESMCAPGYVEKWPVHGPHVEDPPYFAIEVFNVCFCGENGIDYTTIMIDMKENNIVVLEKEFDFAEWKTICGQNLILIGGPVANTIVRQLVDEGISTVEWTTSPGEWEYIEEYTCGILVVAGADRDATRIAVLEIIDYL